MQNKYKNVYLSLGANVGNKFFYLISAINELNELKETIVTKVSNFYKTEPYGGVEQEEFINCALEIKTKYMPYELLKEINRIEEKLERKRIIKWGPRTIDIDIILYDNLNINRTDLIIPHKEYKKRNFVLYPLRDIMQNKNILKYIDQSKGAIEICKYDRKILVSSCLLGENCRYNGGNNLSKLLRDKLQFIYGPVCPEILGGLDTPRNPVEIQKDGTVKDKNGGDVTENFETGTRKVIEIAEKDNIEIALMKSRSPSCGYGKIYDGTFSNKLILGNGKTAGALDKIGVKIVVID